MNMPIKVRYMGRQERLADCFKSKNEVQQVAELTKEKEQVLKKLAEKKVKQSKKDLPTS